MEIENLQCVIQIIIITIILVLIIEIDQILNNQLAIGFGLSYLLIPVVILFLIFSLLSTCTSKYRNQPKTANQ